MLCPWGETYQGTLTVERVKIGSIAVHGVDAMVLLESFPISLTIDGDSFTIWQTIEEV